jgi:hypothetical protein
MSDLVLVGEANNKLTFDFSRFDRWVKLFVDAGVLGPASHGMIEGGHLAGGQYGAVDHQSTIWSIKDGKAVKENVSSWSEPNHQFLRAYLPALQAHLEKTGRLAIYRQHVFDEPVDANRTHYFELYKTLHESAPKLKTIEARTAPIWLARLTSGFPKPITCRRSLSSTKSARKPAMNSGTTLVSIHTHHI